MAGETFQLRFRNNEDTYLSIDEPINFATVDFQLNQKDKGYGRDVSFNGGEVQFEFVKYRNHYLDKLLLYNNTYGFESIVELIITCGTITTIIGELDFATAVTDDLEYFKCKVIQQSSKQIVKRRKAVKVNLLSDKDIDGNYIAPLVPQNILLKSKPIYYISRWESGNIKNGSSYIRYYHRDRPGSEHRYLYVTNPRDLKLHDIETAFVPNSDSTEDGSNITYITAATNLTSVVITIPAVFNKWRVNFHPNVAGNNANATYQYVVEYPGVRQVLKTNLFNTQDEEYSFSEEFKISIPSLSIGDSIKIYEYFDIYNIKDDSWMDLYQTVGIQKIEIEAKTETFNSIAPSFRLIDVMRQVVKSISGLNISAPRFDIAGDFYDNRLLNGNSLRAISNKPFYVSLEDLEKSLVELNIDWEIDAENNIFFGTEDDFYTNNEVKFFPNTQFSSFNKSFNPRFSINEFNYGYKNFQSLKENEELDSADVIHGESRWVLQNKMVENKKEISIEWIRDAFLVETNRRKALSENVTENTASQDDDKLFALDTYTTQSDFIVNNQYVLEHSYDPNNGLLTLTNNGSLNFIVTGIRNGTYFQIVAPSYNQNIYTVNNVSPSSLTLQRITTGAMASYPPTATSFIYKLIVSDIPYTNYTNSGFTNIQNLIASDNYSNLRYSIRRNIEKYWKKYLTTCNLYHRTQNITNTWYKNNKDFSATYTGLTFTESDPIVTGLIDSKPNLTPFMYNDVVFANVEFFDFIALQNSLRTTRGYIKTYDNNGLEILLYPMSMKYENLSKELTIKAEEKFNLGFTPTIETKALSPKSGTTQLSGGNILSDGYSAITAKGVVWNTSSNPTVALSTKTNEGSGDGLFNSLISPLIQFTNYYTRAYAINSKGTGYGQEINFLGGVTNVQIGNQIWMVENLDVTTYRDGTSIPQVTDPTAWSELTTGAWCWYDNSSSNGTTYGKLYNWYAVNDSRGLAPIGYHVPSDAEWNVLINYLGGGETAGLQMKSTTLWNSPNTGAANISGFTGFPAGFRDSFSGVFSSIGNLGFWWSSSERDEYFSWSRILFYNSTLAERDYFSKNIGFSVRLIKD